MSLASVASQDHGHSQAGREAGSLDGFTVPVCTFLDSEGGKQVGRMRLTARAFGLQCYPHCRTSRKYIR